MATNSNMSFHHGPVPASAFNRHAMAVQSGAVDNSSSINHAGSSSGMSGTSGMTVPDNSWVMSNSTGLAVDWSLEEQTKLEEGLLKYANEPSITRYIKIAATIQNKTVRDVALRCRWMTKKENGKRRKPEEHYGSKKLKDRKDKFLDSSSANIIPPPQLLNVSAYPYMMPPSGHGDCLSTEVMPVGSVMKHLLEENAQVFSEITANLAAFRVLENIDLLHRARNNITAILNEMREMPGIMSRMQPLPVSVNEHLANGLLPNPSQGLMFSGASGGYSNIQLKQELI